MKITKRHPITGENNTLDLDVTMDQLIEWKDHGKHIQYVMPHLTVEEREFLISGLLPGEYDEMFPEPDEVDGYNNDEPAF